MRSWGSSPRLLMEDTKFIDCAASENDFIALTQDHKIFVWGSSFSQQPTEIQIPGSSPLTRVFSGTHHLFVLNQRNELYARGRNDDGQCGLGNYSNCRNFQLVPKFTDNKIVYVGGGHYISYCLDNQGNIYSTGKGEYSALMLNDNRSRKLFTKCTNGPPQPADMIAVGCYHIVIGCNMTMPLKHPLENDLMLITNKTLHLYE